VQLSLCLLVVACGALLSIAPASAQGVRRVALVIGNSAYKSTSLLRNPRNDAGDMAVKLKALGFDVIEGQDLDKSAMDRVLRDFAEKLSGADVGLFFYAGHGLQVGGQNYLVPTDAKLTTASAIDFEMVRLDLVLRTMERETGTNVIFIDACRDNPLARNLARALGTRSARIGRGLASVESGEGTLISFSTQPGNVALDGEGRNSPFTGALLKFIATPGDDLSAILINVRNDVMRATVRRQVPWEHSALTSRFYFVDPKPPPPSTPPKPLAGQLELTFWMSVKDSTDPAVLRTYLDRYPDGEFALIARALIEHFERRLKAEAAEREKAQKREEEERIAEAVKRAEQERSEREAALTEELKRAKAAKNAAEAKLLEEKQRGEWLAKTQELKTLTEQMQQAKSALDAAEKQHVTAVKEAEQTTKAAEQAIAAKRAAAKSQGPEKLAALPKIEKPPAAHSLKGRLLIAWRQIDGCRGQRESGTYPVVVANGKLVGHDGRLSGTISATGEARWTFPSPRDGVTFNCSVTLRGGRGSGSCRRAIGRCVVAITVGPQ
jgi:uncharacterized caspase-like protein